MTTTGDDAITLQAIAARFSKLKERKTADTSDFTQMAIEKRFNMPTAQEVRTRARKQFIKRGRSMAIKPLDEFIAGIKRDFPDTDEFYLAAMHVKYTEDKRLRRAINDFIDNRQTKNKMLVNWVRSVVRQKRQLLMQITGYTGGGKSVIGQFIFHLYYKEQKMSYRLHVDPDNPDDAFDVVIREHLPATSDSPATTEPPGVQKLPDVYFTYDYDRSLKTLQEVLEEGEGVLQDEVQTPHGEGSRIMTDALSNAINTCTRRLRLNFIFCTPEEVCIAEVKAYIRVLATNRAKKLSLALLSVPASNKIMTLGVVTFDVSITQGEVSEWYDNHSRGVKERIKALGGTSTPKPPPNLNDLVAILDGMLDALDDEERDYYLDSAANMDELLSQDDLLNSQLTKVKRWIINHSLFNHGHKKGRATSQSGLDESVDVEDPSDPSLPAEASGDDDVPEHFVFDEDEALARYHNQLHVRMFKMFTRDHHPQDWIGKQFDPAVEQPAVSDAVKKVRGWLSQEMGNQYVSFRARQLKRDLGEDIERIVFDQNNTDGVADIEITYKPRDEQHRVDAISVKCEAASKTTQTKKRSDFGPEIERCKELKLQHPDWDVRCIIHYYIYSTGKFAEKAIDFVHPPEKITIKKLKTQTPEIVLG